MKMSAKILSSVSDDDDDRKQQIGCINIHKFFNRNSSFPTGGNHHKGLLLPPDIRDVGKDSMHRETRILSIKIRKDKDATLMNYTDSPRPLPGNTKVPGLTLPRYSYDERESRAAVKVVNESPRFSLDSRESATKVSLHLNPIKQHQSSIIAKLMGLEPFPETTTAKASEIQKTSSASQKDSAAILGSKNGDSLIKPASYLNVTRDPSRHRGCGQGSPNRVSRSGKPPPNESSSVFGEIERMITEIEFMSSNKDLRALKQILDSKQKTNRSLEKQRAHGKLRHGCSESKCLNQKPELSSAYQQDPAVRRRSCFQKASTCPAVIKNSDSNEKATASICNHVSAMLDLQRDTIQNLKYQRENSPACNKKGKVLTPRNNKKSIRKDLEREQTLKLPELKIEKSIRSGRTSPRNQLKVQGEFPLTCSSPNSGNHKNLCSEKSTRRKKVSSKSVHLQSDDEQISEKSNDTRYSSNQGDTASMKSEGINSEVSQIETESTSFLPNSIITSSREQKRSSAESLPSSGELGTNVTDQPSPVSVLDNTFYGEDISSPVEKISTAFQDEERICGWYSENPVHVKASTDGLENLSPNHDQRFINETLLSSRYLKNSSISRPSKQVLCSWLLNDSKAGKWKYANDEKNLNKIVSDMENEILIRKTTMGGLFTSGRKRITTSLQTIMKEVGLEIEQVCNMRYWNAEGDDDGMKKLLTADLKYHQSEDWMDFSGEVPYLVLDIERKIFKDLINEVVTAELLWASHS